MELSRGFLYTESTMHYQRHVYTVIFIADLLLAGYLVCAPLLPKLPFLLRSQPVSSYGRGGEGKVVEQGNLDKITNPVPEHNTLVVPVIGIDAQVLEGTSVAILDKGVWHRPKSSTPDKGGNTVLVAHRFLYTSGPNTFYNLDKLAVGNRFVLFWHGVRYLYEVRSVTVTDPNDASVEAPTQESMVTLWTCTPLFVATQRLVVKAALVQT
jgi:LPXTG-site transpeptidase (sortase) family protein